MAVSLLSKPDSIATPCSVKAKESFLVPPLFDVANCDIKEINWVSGKTLCLEKINNKKSCVCNPYFRQSP